MLWKGADDDVPAGTVGRVEAIYGDEVEVSFPNGGSTGTAGDQVAARLLFTFFAGRLGKVSIDSNNGGSKDEESSRELTIGSRLGSQI